MGNVKNICFKDNQINRLLLPNCYARTLNFTKKEIDLSRFFDSKIRRKSLPFISF